ncbi:unnamed protein product [Sphenostylis stenocarpa]|uniref:Uncharacterized protein n=1 Tax=Sphenostylis stenocarpa TaxID=92480 RepID=A0AA86S5K0_9FABA|nr:unnamed protein product [Sphenostylis stenocarpa]
MSHYDERGLLECSRGRLKLKQSCYPSRVLIWGMDSPNATQIERKFSGGDGNDKESSKPMKRGMFQVGHCTAT